MEPEKRTRPPEDLAPTGRDFAGMVAIQDAAPILRRWLKGAVVLLGLSVASNLGLLWLLWRGVEQLRYLTVAVEAIPK